jgi:hypothetical protein
MRRDEMTATKHTVEEALTTFTLVRGSAGGEADKKACAMSMISWMAGEEWSDHPKCAHPLIAPFVINANDDEATTDEQRTALVKAGCEGIIDTWWIPAEVVLFSLSGERDEEITVADRALRALGRIAAWRLDKVRPDITGANLRGANLTGADLGGADLTGAYLRGANLTGADLTGAYLTGAYLRGANLTGADLRGADLTGADLGGANLDNTRGNEYTQLPEDYEVSESGLIVRTS